MISSYHGGSKTRRWSDPWLLPGTAALLTKDLSSVIWSQCSLQGSWELASHLFQETSENGRKRGNSFSWRFLEGGKCPYFVWPFCPARERMFKRIFPWYVICQSPLQPWLCIWGWAVKVPVSLVSSCPCRCVGLWLLLRPVFVWWENSIRRWASPVLCVILGTAFKLFPNCRNLKWKNHDSCGLSLCGGLTRSKIIRVVSWELFLIPPVPFLLWLEGADRVLLQGRV